jgi:hypothetical protein
VDKTKVVVRLLLFLRDFSFGKSALLCNVLSLPVQSFLKFPFMFLPPFAPFFDSIFSCFQRTRRLKVKSGIGRVAQTHLGEKAGLQILASQQFD